MVPGQPAGPLKGIPLAVHSGPALIGQDDADAGGLERLEDEGLAGRVRAGSSEAFAELVRRFQDRVFSFLWQLTGNAHDAEDLAQVTFLKAFMALQNREPPHCFGAWLFTIARRTAANHFRGKVSTEPLLAGMAEAASAEEDPRAAMEGAERRAGVWRMARRLKPKQFQAVWLRYAEDFSVGEVARIMGTNVIHVKVLLHRARRQLARWLGEAASG